MIAVVGGTGYLGSALVRAFVRSGQQVAVLKRPTSSLRRIAEVQSRLRLVDLSERSVAELLGGSGPVTVINCATVYGRSGESLDAVREANFEMPKMLLDAACRGSVQSFISCDTALPRELSPYAKWKAAFRDLCVERRCAFPVLNVVLEHFYGPGDDPSKFVTRMVREALKPGNIVPMTIGTQRRDFIYIDDVVRAFELLLERGVDFSAGAHSVPLGSGVSVTIRELISLIQRFAKTDAAFEFGKIPLREGEPNELVADISQLKKLGWAPRIFLADGIQMVVESERRGV